MFFLPAVVEMTCHETHFALLRKAYPPAMYHSLSKTSCKATV